MNTPKFTSCLLCLFLKISFSFGQTTSPVSLKADTSFYIRPLADSIILFKLDKGKKVKFTVESIKADTPTFFKTIISKISLRQSFQTKKDKEEAAFLNLVYPKDSVGSSNFNFAFGYDFLNDYSVSAFKPFIEWQKNTLLAKKQNVFLAGLNFQTSFWDLADDEKPGWSPYIIATVNYKNDVVKVTKGTQTSLYIVPSFRGKGRKFYPLPDVMMVSSIVNMYYNVYLGTEFENRSQVEEVNQKGNVWRAYGRITANFYPLPKVLNNKLEIIPDYIYRDAFSNTSKAEERVNKLWKFTVNVIIITKEKSQFADVKIGYDYIHGSDPTIGFDKQQVNTFSLKIKI